MNEEPRQILGELIANPKYGRFATNDPQRCEGLLRDLCGQYRTEISALVSAAKEKIPGELLLYHNSTSPEELLARLTRRLQGNVALEEKAARWAVESWALALGVISADALRDIHLQQQQAKKQEITELTISEEQRRQEEQRQRAATELQRKAAERQLAEEKQRRLDADRKLELERLTKAKQDLLKAVMTGSVIGVVALAGLALSHYLTSHSPSQQPVTTAPSPSSPGLKPPSIATQPSQSPSFPPVVSVPSPQPPASPPSMQMNATIVGESGSKNIRSGPGTNYSEKHIAYPGDRVRVIEFTRNSDNFPWYKVYFPQSGAEGWIAGHLLAIDGQDPYQHQAPAKPKTSSAQTNATISGTPETKNIRSGPGTVYGVVGTTHIGERVQILDSGYDKENYKWYKIYHPQSGTRGWIADQLITLD